MLGTLAEPTTTPRPTENLPWKPVGWLMLGTVVGLVCAAGYEAGRVVVGANVHAALPGMLFRSAQLSSQALTRVIGEHQIKTVINLRGECPEMAWYQDQCQTLKGLGITHHDIPFSSTGLPPVPEYRELLKVLQSCEFPVLLHCRRGADRTGLAGATALLVRADADLDTARQQLSWRYGHISVSASGTLNRVFDMYEAWLTDQQQPHAPERFAHWVNEVYRPGRCWATIEPLEVPTQLEHGKPAAARFRVHNESGQPWRFSQSPRAGVHLQYILRKKDGSKAFLDRAGLFEALVPAGRSIELTLALPAVRSPGKYTLLVDMEDPHQGWFFMAGSKPYRSEVEVLPEYLLTRTMRSKQ